MRERASERACERRETAFARKHDPPRTCSIVRQVVCSAGWSPRPCGHIWRVERAALVDDLEHSRASVRQPRARVRVEPAAFPPAAERSVRDDGMCARHRSGHSVDSRLSVRRVIDECGDGPRRISPDPPPKRVRRIFLNGRPAGTRSAVGSAARSCQVHSQSVLLAGHAGERDAAGSLLASPRRWCEHDPAVIMETVTRCMHEVLRVRAAWLPITAATRSRCAQQDARLLACNATRCLLLCPLPSPSREPLA